MIALSRKQIITALTAALKPLPFTNALWEAGSAAFGRADKWSDIDIHIDVADDKVEETFAAIETALLTLTPITLKVRVPEPTWHGHSQKFYQLENASPYLMIDVAVMKASSTSKFTEREVHGEARILFDKLDVVQAKPVDIELLEQTLRARIQYWQANFEWMQLLVTKSLLREQPLDALAFYNGMVVRPLVELLRIKYDPHRYNFGQRYLHHYLPPADIVRLTELTFVGDSADIPTKQARAQKWVNALLIELADRYA